MPLSLHLFIHLALAVLVGLLVGRFFNRERIGIIAGILGGFLIDLDHVLEYFFVFGLRFNIANFIQGRQFLVSDKVLVIFHAWEYIPILLFIAWLLRRRKNVYVFIIALTLGGTVHLISDCFLNHYPPRNYSIIYRASKGFSGSYILNSAQLEANTKYRKELGI